MKRRLLLLLGIAAVLPAQAQLTAPVKNSETTVTVTGTRDRDSKVEMSKWRMAQMPHVVVFSEGEEKELRETARNLEKLHFLLSTLYGRVDAPDETMRMAVFMIGQAGEFEQLRLTDLRWQYGPFPSKFAKTIYYDPRAEGSVLATTEDGVNVVLKNSEGQATNRNCDGNGEGLEKLNYSFVSFRFDGGEGELVIDPFQITSQYNINEIAFCQSAQSRLYSGFAQNYLLTYFPAAYPRWFLQGFGELFATLKAGDDFVEYGQLPIGFSQVMDRFGSYPIKDVLNGRYLSGKGRMWTPFDAWRLVHFLYFSDEWKPRLHKYLSAVARGVDPRSAAEVFGDPASLHKAVMAYGGRKTQFERMTFPADRVPEPAIRQMTRAEAGLIRGRLELGARIEVPADGSERAAALARRADWLARLRENARQFPNLIENQLLLAEAECRSGNPQECLEASERAIAQSPTDATALVWKGTALVQLAMRAPAAERQHRLHEARKIIAQANRLDTEGILPLIAFYNSFADAGERVPDNALDALAKVVASSPAAPGPRLKLGQEFLERGLKDAAREILLPVAKGAFQTPEQKAAAAMLPKGGKRDSGS